MIKLCISLHPGKRPQYLENWARAHNLLGGSWDHVKGVFTRTTNGKMEGEKGAMEYYLVFDDDQDATWFLLRWS